MRTVAGLTLSGDRRAISSDATGLAVLMYSLTRMFNTLPARWFSIGIPRKDGIGRMVYYRESVAKGGMRRNWGWQPSRASNIATAAGNDAKDGDP